MARITRAAWSQPITAKAQVTMNNTRDLATVPPTDIRRFVPAPSSAIASGANVRSLIICWATSATPQLAWCRY